MKKPPPLRRLFRPYRAEGMYFGEYPGLRALRFTPGYHISGFLRHRRSIP